MNLPLACIHILGTLVIFGFSQSAEWSDRSWDALRIAILFNPAANLAALFVGGLFWYLSYCMQTTAPTARRKRGDILVFLAPVFGMAVNLASLAVMGIHGC